MINFIKYYKLPIIIIVLLIILIGIYIQYDLKEDTTKYYVSILYIEQGNQKYELKVRNKDKVTLQFENEVESVFTTIPRQGKERIAYPEIDKIESLNTLEGRNPKSKMLWDLSFMDSFRYIKYLVDKEGYVIEMYASTQQYIEIFMSKEGTYKRVVVFRDSIMVSDMSNSAKLPLFEDYISLYRINK